MRALPAALFTVCALSACGSATSTPSQGVADAGVTELPIDTSCAPPRLIATGASFPHAALVREGGFVLAAWRDAEGVRARAFSTRFEPAADEATWRPVEGDEVHVTLREGRGAIASGGQLAALTVASDGALTVGASTSFEGRARTLIAPEEGTFRVALDTTGMAFVNGERSSANVPNSPTAPLNLGTTAVEQLGGYLAFDPTSATSSLRVRRFGFGHGASLEYSLYSYTIPGRSASPVAVSGALAYRLVQEGAPVANLRLERFSFDGTPRVEPSLWRASGAAWSDTTAALHPFAAGMTMAWAARSSSGARNHRVQVAWSDAGASRTVDSAPATATVRVHAVEALDDGSRMFVLYSVERASGDASLYGRCVDR